MKEVFIEHREDADSQKLTRAILYSMIVAVILGCVFHEVLKSNNAVVIAFDQYLVQGLFELVGQYFVRALKMIVVPLVFFSLVAGLTTRQDEPVAVGGGRLGARAGYTFILYLGTTMVAVSLALFLALIVDPGNGVAISTDNGFVPPERQPLVEVFTAFVPTNILGAFSSGNMLAVIFVSLVFGYAMNHCGAAGHRIGAWCQDMNTLVTRVIFLIMACAPYGVFVLVFEVFADQGIHFMANIAAYFLTVTGALILHGLIVYSGIVKAFGKVSILVFWNKIRQVMLFAFSTASSAATIGVNLRNATQRLGVRNDVASFTIPLGATINMDGTAIMQGVAVVFIASAYGFDLTSVQYLEVIVLATLASVGTAAVPSAGLVTLSVVLLQVNLPAEAIGLIIGVDRLLDMMRTAVNVAGDAAITLAVGHREKAIDHDIYNAKN